VCFIVSDVCPKEVPRLSEVAALCHQWDIMFEDILNNLDVSLEPFAVCELYGNCQLGLGPRSHAILHYVLGGEGEAVIAGGTRFPVAQGSVILVPAFVRHSLHGVGAEKSPIPECRPLDDGFQIVQEGKGARSMTAVCGRVDVFYKGLQGVFPLIRSPMVEHLATDDTVRMALDSFVKEMASPALGTLALGRTLLLQCMIVLLRRRRLADDQALKWIDGVADENTWGALKAMLETPGNPHSVDSLADQVGTSRATFARRFQKSYGVGPMQLLRDIRLRRSAEILTSTDLPIKRIADMVGYRSRSYFSRAFEEEFGLPPDAFRQEVRAQERP